MFENLFGASSKIGGLKWSLDDSSRTHRSIAGRVSSALEASGNTDFDAALADQQKKGQKVDLEREMVDLASTQLRFEASSTLLSKAYAGLRSAIRSNG